MSFARDYSCAGDSNSSKAKANDYELSNNPTSIEGIEKVIGFNDVMHMLVKSKG